jgi:hypothetical protein
VRFENRVTTSISGDKVENPFCGRKEVGHQMAMFGDEVVLMRGDAIFAFTKARRSRENL